VVIVSPNVAHASCALAAARRGLHVLVEKPMALTDEECNLMMAAAQEAGVMCAVLHCMHWSPALAAARASVSAGATMLPSNRACHPSASGCQSHAHRCHWQCHLSRLHGFVRRRPRRVQHSGARASAACAHLSTYTSLSRTHHNSTLTVSQGITGTQDRRSAPLLDMGVHAIDAAASVLGPVHSV
jgi:predicted dehydrogenase